MKHQTNQSAIEWKEVPLKSIIKLRGGYAFKSEKFTEIGIPIIRISNFNNSNVNLSEAVYYPEESIKDYKEFTLNAGDILIAMSGATTGKIGLVTKENIPCLLNQRVGKFEIIKKNVYDNYLLLFVRSKNFQKEVFNIASGCAQPNISGNQIGSIKIPLPFLNGHPDLQTQKHIVAILEKAEQLKEKRKQSLKLLDKYVKSTFNEMFVNKDFPKGSIGELCDVISGSTPSTIKEEYWNGDIDWVTPAELIDGDNYYYYGSQRKITRAGLDSASNLFPKETVMLTTRAPIGKVAIAGKEMCTNQGFKNMICKKELNNIYLYCWLLFNKSYLNSLGVGATFKEVSKKMIERVEIPLPPLSLQQTFASIVEKVEKLKEKQKQSLAEIETLFNALMQKAFNGELIR